MILETHVGQPKATPLQIESQNPAVQPRGNKTRAGPQQNGFRVRESSGCPRCEEKTRTADDARTEESGFTAETVHPDACSFRRPARSAGSSAHAKG
jgi:hypothetical protein